MEYASDESHFGFGHGRCDFNSFDFGFIIDLVLKLSFFRVDRRGWVDGANRLGAIVALKFLEVLSPPHAGVCRAVDKGSGGRIVTFHVVTDSASGHLLLLVEKDDC